MCLFKTRFVLQLLYVTRLHNYNLQINNIAKQLIIILIVIGV